MCTLYFCHMNKKCHDIFSQDTFFVKNGSFENLPDCFVVWTKKKKRDFLQCMINSFKKI